jgi:hypothetical protein
LSKRLLAMLSGVVAIAVIAAGCGSSSGDSSSASLTKAEFLKQGNAICAKGNDEIEARFEAFGKEHHLSQSKQLTEAELAEASETILIPTVRKQVDGIRALGAPSGEEQEVEKVLDAADEALEKAEENPKLLAAQNAGPFARANKLAREYGLVKCGEE